MPSIAQIEDGMPILTSFTPTHKKSQNENELFQNGISNNKRSDKFDSDYLYPETNGNGIHYINVKPKVKEMNQTNGSLVHNNQKEEPIINDTGVTVPDRSKESSVDPSLAWKLTGTTFTSGK